MDASLCFSDRLHASLWLWGFDERPRDTLHCILRTKAAVVVLDRFAHMPPAGLRHNRDDTKAIHSGEGHGSHKVMRDDEWATNPHVDHTTDGEAKRASLREDLDKQQLKTFTRWWNSWLSERQLSIADLCEDIKPGVLPIQLLEILSESSCGRFVKTPRTTFQKLENFNIFLEQLRAKSIKLVNIGAEDLASGDRKLVLGLTWTLILYAAGSRTQSPPCHVCVAGGRGYLLTFPREYL